MPTNAEVRSDGITAESLLGPLPSSLEQLHALFDALKAAGACGQTLGDARKIASQDLNAVYEEVMVQCREERWTEASRVALQLAMHEPRNARFLFLAATCLQRIKEFQAAAGLFGLSLLEQMQPIIVFRMAECLAAAGEYQLARDAFDACTEMCRSDGEHHDLEKACEAALLVLAEL